METVCNKCHQYSLAVNRLESLFANWLEELRSLTPLVDVCGDAFSSEVSQNCLEPDSCTSKSDLAKFWTSGEHVGDDNFATTISNCHDFPIRPISAGASNDMKVEPDKWGVDQIVYTDDEVGMISCDDRSRGARNTVENDLGGIRSNYPENVCENVASSSSSNAFGSQNDHIPPPADSDVSGVTAWTVNGSLAVAESKKCASNGAAMDQTDVMDKHPVGYFDVDPEDGGGNPTLVTSGRIFGCQMSCCVAESEPMVVSSVPEGEFDKDGIQDTFCDIKPVETEFEVDDLAKKSPDVYFSDRNSVECSEEFGIHAEADQSDYLNSATDEFGDVSTLNPFHSPARSTDKSHIQLPRAISLKLKKSKKDVPQRTETEMERFKSLNADEYVKIVEVPFVEDTDSQSPLNPDNINYVTLCGAARVASPRNSSPGIQERLSSPSSESVDSAVRIVYSCSICGAAFTYRQGCRAHIRQKHFGLDNRTCPDCGRIYRSSAAFKVHYRRAHLKVGTGKDCKKCGESLRTFKDLKDHMDLVHPPETPGSTFGCPVSGCGRRFGRLSDLRRHVNLMHN